MEYFFLAELSRVLKEGVRDLNQAAERLTLPLSVVQRTFEDGLLKGYWKIADGQLFMHSSDIAHSVYPTSVRHGNQFPNMFCRADNYSRGFDLTKLAMPPARKLAIVACMDARLTIEPMLGLKTGDAHIIRNAEGSSQKTWCAR